MAKAISPSFVLSLELKSNVLMFSVIEDELEICRVMYNTVLGRYLKLETQMKREKSYKKWIREYRFVSKKLERNPTDEVLVKEKKIIQKNFTSLRDKYSLNEYASHDWVKSIRKHFGNKVNSAVAQKTATRAWNTFSKKLFGQSKKVRFIKKGEMQSFEGKSNTTGWRYVDGFILYNGLHTELSIKPKDDYASEIIKNVSDKKEFSYKTNDSYKKDFYRIKYVRIVKKTIRGKVRYFANLVIAGYPPSKNRKLGKGRVGIDTGTSTIAVASLTKAALFNLADQVKDIAHEIKLIQGKMDRSKRAMNPTNYKVNGTLKKGKKTWVFSNRYQKLRSRFKELHRKQAKIRKFSHNRLANLLLPLGDHFFTETMNFKSLQKRKKETEVSEKTGKIKRKKRFGKTLGNRAPATFMSILKNKVKRYGGSFKEVNTRKFKASQYCHIRNGFFKKQLSERWHKAGDINIQRDLYSAFLLMNSNDSGTGAIKTLCDETFNNFKNLHDQEIKTIIKQKKMILNSGIITKN